MIFSSKKTFLCNGDIVVYRYNSYNDLDYERRIVDLENNCLTDIYGRKQITLDAFDDNLLCDDNPSFDIIKIIEMEERTVSVTSEDDDWIPKKDEQIFVKDHNGGWFIRTFKTYIDGKYWCESIIENSSLCGYLEAKPIPKPSEPKFKVGDVVTDGKNGAGVITKKYPNKNSFFVKFQGGAGEYCGEDLTKLKNEVVKENTVSFRGKSKGILFNENIVFYYNNKYKQLMIGESEKPFNKTYIWIDSTKFLDGDIVTTDFEKLFIHIDGMLYNIGNNGKAISSNPMGKRCYYKVIEV